MSNMLRIAGFSIFLVLGLAATDALASPNTLVLCDSNPSELPGESTAAGATKCVDVTSWSWGSEAASTVGSAGPMPGRPQLDDFTLQKPIDSSTTTFFKFLAAGDYFHGTLQFRIYITCNSSCTTPTPYFTVDLTESLVTKQSIGGDSEGRPSESVSLTYKSVKVCYRPTDNSGMLGQAVCTTYDRSTSAVSDAQR